MRRKSPFSSRLSITAASFTILTQDFNPQQADLTVVHRTMSASHPLFEEVVSRDLLGFSFGGRSYAAQITDAVAKTKVLCAVKVERKKIGGGDEKDLEVVWVTHNFGFLGEVFDVEVYPGLALPSARSIRSLVLQTVNKSGGRNMYKMRQHSRDETNVIVGSFACVNGCDWDMLLSGCSLAYGRHGP